MCGHKGALWLKAMTRGVTAHGSMPDKGVNAVYKAARAVSKLEEFGFNVAPHAVMGSPTLNVGWMHGGLNVNSVPDKAEIGIDIRSIPGQRHARVSEEIAAALGSDVEVSTMVDVESVWTDPANPWMRQVFATCEAVQGTTPVVKTAPYFTDASALTPALGAVPDRHSWPRPRRHGPPDRRMVRHRQDRRSRRHLPPPHHPVVQPLICTTVALLPFVMCGLGLSPPTVSSSGLSRGRMVQRIRHSTSIAAAPRVTLNDRSACRSLGPRTKSEDDTEFCGDSLPPSPTLSAAGRGENHRASPAKPACNSASRFSAGPLSGPFCIALAAYSKCSNVE